jgi:hypothetical protein
LDIEALPQSALQVTLLSEERLYRLHWLSRILDTALSIPGTSLRFGLDGVLGLIPGIGDPMGALLSSYVIFESARVGAPKRLLLRMIGNVALESLIGVIPLLGDLFDFGWKANVRNLALLRANQHVLMPYDRSPWQIILWIVLALFVVLAIFTTVSFFVLRFLYQMIIS